VAAGLAGKRGNEGQEQNSNQLSSAFNAIRSTVLGKFSPGYLRPDTGIFMLNLH